MNIPPFPPATSRPPAPGAGAQGYRLSSDELHAGLDVRALSLTALPAELVAELFRLRSCWGETFGVTGPGAVD